MKSLLVGTTLFSTAFAGTVNQPIANPVQLPDRCKEAGEIALTFDGGPGAMTGQLLNAIQELNVRVTFHLATNHLNQPSVEAFALGAKSANHVIGLFWNPPTAMTGMKDDEIIAALIEESNKIHKVLAIHPRFLRLPHKSVDKRVYDIVTGMGFLPTDFNFDPKDYASSDPDTLAGRYKAEFDKLGGFTSRYISVHHDSAPRDLGPAIKAIVTLGTERKYKFLGLDQCLDETFVYKSDAAGKGPMQTAAGSTETTPTGNTPTGNKPDNTGNDDDQEQSDPKASTPVVPVKGSSGKTAVNCILGALAMILPALV